MLVFCSDIGDFCSSQTAVHKIEFLISHGLTPSCCSPTPSSLRSFPLGCHACAEMISFHRAVWLVGFAVVRFVSFDSCDKRTLLQEEKQALPKELQEKHITSLQAGAAAISQSTRSRVLISRSRIPGPGFSSVTGSCSIVRISNERHTSVVW